MFVPRNPQVNAKMGFAPLKLVDMAVSHVSVKLYPRITATMPVYERAHAFQVNKTALTNLPGMDFGLVLDAFGTQLNSSSTVEGLISDWQRFLKEQWMDFNHHAILFFHKSNGERIVNTTVAGHPEILLLVINGSINACRQQDVKFVRVQCSLDLQVLSWLTFTPSARY
jgi:hypothetical protein